MIVIRGEIVINPPPGLTGLEADIFRAKQAQAAVYSYTSVEELRFELRTRRLLTEAAAALNSSGVQFASFQESRCNPAYWARDSKGGFRLLPHITPAQGIRNIFREGPKYAFECATGIVIVLYKGMLDSLGDLLFNLWFGGLLLYDWHYDQDLHLVDSKNPANAVPGDVQYFKNPDVAPEFAVWQGENVLRLPDDLFYGHGIGIRSADEIIEALNRKRRAGSTQSAFMENILVHPNYPVLFRTLIGSSAREEEAYAAGAATGKKEQPAVQWPGEPLPGITARIGSLAYQE